MKTELPNENANQQPACCSDTHGDNIVKDALCLENRAEGPICLDETFIKLEVKQELDYEVDQHSNSPIAMSTYEAKFITQTHTGMQNSDACYDTTAVKTILSEAPVYEEKTYSTIAQSFPVVNNFENSAHDSAIDESGKVHEADTLLKLLTAEKDMGIIPPRPSTSTDYNCSKSYELPDKAQQRKVIEINPDNSDVDLHWEMKNNKFVCKLCNKFSLEIESCRIHIRSHLGFRPFTCTHCKKAFASKRCLQSHIDTVHLNYYKYECDICKRRFSRRCRLLDHIDKHNGHTITPKFDCAECGKVFNWKSSLLHHIVNVHNCVRTQNLCEVCGKVFHTRDGLFSHRRVHKEKRFKCDKCDMKFTFPGKLSNHIASLHSNERNFECDVCSKTFRSKAAVAKHKERHHEVKRKMHKCTKCEKSFRSRDFLKEHLLKHEGIRKYSCETCGKTFAQLSHLQAHKFSHGEKKFVCSICGAKFNRNDNMKSHVKRHETKKTLKNI